jgi:hypothetical protein
VSVVTVVSDLGTETRYETVHTPYYLTRYTIYVRTTYVYPTYRTATVTQTTVLTTYTTVVR